MACEQWVVYYSCGCEVTLRRDTPDCDGSCGDDDTLTFLPDQNSEDVCGACDRGPVYMSPPASSSEAEDDDEDENDEDEGDENDENENDEDEDEDDVVVIDDDDDE
ncbi:hypothetical protein MGYG_09124 [Nannizzia gypsea CBS 118893]|uniref:Uncharacterized protein n=1 Tax=Arthroderma gypseum (strain ATCC MYA-4604 / CBS 118893) TaxID=535722 RepID=E4UZ89_ARTGP|nr:hypothetical protein MGYG_09124 [Nannizzia gypsea CBS 118893]EFR03419.1 hypothetical protein MGYG_09124 [Nannizzia gypsea CBS 118893]